MSLPTGAFPAAAVQPRLAELGAVLLELRGRLAEEERRPHLRGPDVVRDLESRIAQAADIEAQLQLLWNKDSNLAKMKRKVENPDICLTATKRERLQDHFSKASASRDRFENKLRAWYPSEWQAAPPSKEAEVQDPPRKKVRPASPVAPKSTDAAVASSALSSGQQQAALAQAWEAGRRGVPPPFLASFTGHGFPVVEARPPYSMPGASYPAAAHPQHHFPPPAQPPDFTYSGQPHSAQQPTLFPGHADVGDYFPGHFHWAAQNPAAAFNQQAARPQLRPTPAVAVKSSRRPPPAHDVTGVVKEEDDIDDKNAIYL